MPFLFVPYCNSPSNQNIDLTKHLGLYVVKGDLIILGFYVSLLLEVFIVSIYYLHFFCDIPTFSFQSGPQYKLIRIHTQSSIICCPTDYPYPSIMACVHLPSSRFFGVILILYNNPYKSLTKTPRSCVRVVWWWVT